MMKVFRSIFPVGAAVIASTLFATPAHAASLGSLLTAAKNDLSPFGLVGCFAFAGIGLIIFGNGVLKLLRGGRGGGGGVGESILSVRCFSVCRRSSLPLAVRSQTQAQAAV